jgi:hypothetical protein
MSSVVSAASLIAQLIIFLLFLSFNIVKGIQNHLSFFASKHLLICTQSLGYSITAITQTELKLFTVLWKMLN